jgi:hypothetical protein
MKKYLKIHLFELIGIIIYLLEFFSLSKLNNLGFLDIWKALAPTHFIYNCDGDKVSSPPQTVPIGQDNPRVASTKAFLI